MSEKRWNLQCNSFCSLLNSMKAYYIVGSFHLKVTFRNTITPILAGGRVHNKANHQQQQHNNSHYHISCFHTTKIITTYPLQATTFTSTNCALLQTMCLYKPSDASCIAELRTQKPSSNIDISTVAFPLKYLHWRENKRSYELEYMDLWRRIWSVYGRAFSSLCCRRIINHVIYGRLHRIM